MLSLLLQPDTYNPTPVACLIWRSQSKMARLYILKLPRRIHEEQVSGRTYRPGVLFHFRASGACARRSHAGENGPDQGVYQAPERIHQFGSCGGPVFGPGFETKRAADFASAAAGGSAG